jgi:hypothetical protein
MYVTLDISYSIIVLIYLIALFEAWFVSSLIVTCKTWLAHHSNSLSHHTSLQYQLCFYLDDDSPLQGDCVPSVNIKLET